MKKIAMPVTIAALAFIAFVTASPRIAGSAPRPYQIVSITDSVTMGQVAQRGWVIRAATVCPTTSGGINTTVIQCVVFQAP